MTKRPSGQHGPKSILTGVICRAFIRRDVTLFPLTLVSEEIFSASSLAESRIRHGRFIPAPDTPAVRACQSGLPDGQGRSNQRFLYFMC
ncbi:MULTISPECIES: hypothetical protein [unclassified Pantoea]|uniref:hypothetical protein n=1 Tax=unclassified Pantoea TaxID=2630326 RepID=UPI002553D276|nr:MULTISPECIES: hypothetical protein [unclassified Pantoea]